MLVVRCKTGIFLIYFHAKFGKYIAECCIFSCACHSYFAVKISPIFINLENMFYKMSSV